LEIEMIFINHLFIFILLSTAFASTCFAEENSKWTCTKDFKIVGNCFTVHGRLSVYNGNPSVRLWPVGTQRLLGVLPDEFSPKQIDGYLGFGSNVYGDFTVCPITKEISGLMQLVCIDSGKNLVVENFNSKSDQAEVFRLKESWIKQLGTTK
jgi:hypothetical protein